ncbi:peptidyl-prolyl cis-trans isomerase A (cyclophilin A) [Brevundimonas alba]|uniref:Peptidyl-prolyl cis-trans isomerase n=1 Tax=Brevundimonas alba TaxID=74314 RepID=A0A7X5YLN7_9CAUL|nr:peptidylprolyl isomerase [Brevundimonas alba]NJC41912.1 peptidyl-prolyl cis-trans isomerase A (cyclophilin A) [Brevundimonas alba]
MNWLVAVVSAATIQTPAASVGQTVGPPMPPIMATIHTDRGDIQLALDVEAAPVTVCNFVRYAQAGRYRGGRFFRTVVAETNDNPNPIDVIQAETDAGSDDAGFGPIPLERTRDTGLRHAAGTISMARDGPDTATSSFFIVTRDTPALDFGGGRNPDGQGFAAFGVVTGGLDLVRGIQAQPAQDEQLTEPVAISDIEVGPAAACLVDWRAKGS